MRSNTHFSVTCVLLVTAASLVSGCGTLLYSNTTDVTVESRPSEAQVIYNGQVVGETPATVTLDNDEGLHQIIVRKDGFEPGSCIITRKFNLRIAAMDYIPGVLGTIGPFGYATAGTLWLISSAAAAADFLDGSIYKLSQDSCTIDLFER